MSSPHSNPRKPSHGSESTADIAGARNETRPSITRSNHGPKEKTGPSSSASGGALDANSSFGKNGASSGSGRGAESSGTSNRRIVRDLPGQGLSRPIAGRDAPGRAPTPSFASIIACMDLLHYLDRMKYLVDSYKKSGIFRRAIYKELTNVWKNAMIQFEIVEDLRLAGQASEEIGFAEQIWTQLIVAAEEASYEPISGNVTTLGTLAGGNIDVESSTMQADPGQHQENWKCEGLAPWMQIMVTAADPQQLEEEKNAMKVLLSASF